MPRAWRAFGGKQIPPKKQKLFSTILLVNIIKNSNLTTTLSANFSLFSSEFIFLLKYSVFMLRKGREEGYFPDEPVIESREVIW